MDAQINVIECMYSLTPCMPNPHKIPRSLSTRLLPGQEASDSETPKPHKANHVAGLIAPYPKILTV